MGRRFPLLVFFRSCLRFQWPFLLVSGALMPGVIYQQHRDTSRVLSTRIMLVRQLSIPVATATGACSCSSISSWDRAQRPPHRYPSEKLVKLYLPHHWEYTHRKIGAKRWSSFYGGRYVYDILFESPRYGLKAG